jgi:hypothetical protein
MTLARPAQSPANPGGRPRVVYGPPHVAVTENGVAERA